MAGGLTRGTVTNVTSQNFFQDNIAPVLMAAGWRFVELVTPNVSGATALSSVWVSPTTKQSGGGGGFGGSGYAGASDILDIPVQADGVTAETGTLFDDGLWDFDSSNGYYYEGVVLIFEFNSATVLRVKVAEQYADSGTPFGPRCKRACNGSDSSVAVASTNWYTQSESWIGLGDSAAFHWVGFTTFNGTISWGAEARRDLFILATKVAGSATNFFCVAGKLPQNPSAAAVYDNSSAVFMGDSADGSHNYTWAGISRRGTFRSSRAPLFAASGPAGPFCFGAEMAFPSQDQGTNNWVDTSYALYGYNRFPGDSNPKSVRTPTHTHPMAGQAWLWGYAGAGPSGRAPLTHYLPDFLVCFVETLPQCGGIDELRIITPRRPLTRHHEQELHAGAIGDTSAGLPPAEDDEAMTQMTPFTKYYFLGLLDSGTGSAVAGVGQLVLAVKGQ